MLSSYMPLQCHAQQQYFYILPYKHCTYEHLPLGLKFIRRTTYPCCCELFTFSVVYEHPYSKHHPLDISLKLIIQPTEYNNTTQFQNIHCSLCSVCFYNLCVKFNHCEFTFHLKNVINCHIQQFEFKSVILLWVYGIDTKMKSA